MEEIGRTPRGAMFCLVPCARYGSASQCPDTYAAADCHGTGLCHGTLPKQPRAVQMPRLLRSAGTRRSMGHPAGALSADAELALGTLLSSAQVSVGLDFSDFVTHLLHAVCHVQRDAERSVDIPVPCIHGHHM